MKNRLFWRVVLSYVIVLIIPTAINWRTHIVGADALRDNSAKYEERRLQDVAGEVDGRLEGIKDTARQLSGDGRVLSLLSASENADKTPFLAFSYCIDTVYNYLYPKNFIKYTNYYIYFQRYDYIMIHETIYRPSLYHQSRIMKFNEREPLAENWGVWLRASHFAGDFVYADYESVGYPDVDGIIYIQTLPLTFNPTAKGAFVVEISKETIRELFAHGQSKASFAYIEDAEGNRVLSSGDAALEFSGVKQVETSVVSKLNGWRYVTLKPEAEIYADFLKERRFLYILTGTVLAAGIGLALLFSNSNAKPLIRATDALNAYFGGEYTLTQGVAKLISDQTDLRRDLSEQKPYLRESFLSGLLSGRVFTAREIADNADYLELPVLSESVGGGLYVVLFRLYNEGGDADIVEALSWKSVVRAEIVKALPDALIHDVYRKRLAVVCRAAEDGFARNFTDSYAAMNDNLKRAYGMGVFAGVSSKCQSPSDLWRGFLQGERALKYAWGERAVFYDALPEGESDYYYPIEIESRLVSVIKIGDAAQVGFVLDVIYNENAVRRTLSIESSHELIVELRATLGKAAAKDEAATVKIHEIKNKNGFDETFAFIREICADICRHNAKERKDTGKKLISSVISYIGDNFSDPNLGLYAVSAQFNLSESYFSSFFKTGTGMNFADYLEKTRLDKARELLQTDQTIAEIAESVGYNSDQSFRRAFKRVYGCSPKQSRG